MILMIDNYDSFTYNLVQYLSELGADLVTVRNDDLSAREIENMNPTGIVISPGPGRPDNSGVSLDIIDRLKSKTPILGVCLGHQAIGQSFGGVIDYAPKLMHGKVSQINFRSSTLFKNAKAPFFATRYHSLVIRRETISDQFEITAETDDGTVMAIESDKLALYGVQFHPESIMTPQGKTILKNFLDVVTRRAGK